MDDNKNDLKSHKSYNENNIDSNAKYSYYRFASVENILDDYNKLCNITCLKYYDADMATDINTAFKKLKELNAKQYACAYKYYVKDMIQNDIAKELNITQSTVKKHIENGIQNIRIFLIGKDAVDKINKEHEEKVTAFNVAKKLRGELI